MFVQQLSIFNKWGWFFDKERKQVNKAVLTAVEI